MKLIAKSGASAVLALFAVAVLLAPSSGKVEARPQYKKAFEKKFSKVKPVDCNICHAGEDKKERNEYGKVFGKSLGEGAKNVKDAKKIEKALDASAKEKDGDGNPYGDKLKKGERPAG